MPKNKYKLEDNLKDIIFSLRLSKNEYELLKKTATKLNISMSVLLRSSFQIKKLL